MAYRIVSYDPERVIVGETDDPKVAADVARRRARRGGTVCVERAGGRQAERCYRGGRSVFFGRAMRARRR